METRFAIAVSIPSLVKNVAEVVDSLLGFQLSFRSTSQRGVRGREIGIRVLKQSFEAAMSSGFRHGCEARRCPAERPWRPHPGSSGNPGCE